MPAESSAPSPLACASPGGAVDRGPWPSRWTSRCGPVEVRAAWPAGPYRPLSDWLSVLAPALSVAPRDSLSQRSKRPIVEGLADLLQEGLSIGDVVDRGEPIRQQLLGSEEVGEVRPRVVAARLAGAGRVDRTRLVQVARVANVQLPLARPELPIASHPGRQNAVEEVDPAFDGGEEVRWRADPHQV